MRIHSQTLCLLVDSDRWWHPTGSCTLYSWPWNSCSASAAVDLNCYSHPSWVKNPLWEGLRKQYLLSRYCKGAIVQLCSGMWHLLTGTLHATLGSWDPLKPAISKKIIHYGFGNLCLYLGYSCRCQKKPIQTTFDLMENIQDYFFKLLSKSSDFDKRKAKNLFL